MDGLVTGCDGMTESACENADNPLLGEPVVSVGVVFLIDGLLAINSSISLACNPFGGVTSVFAVGSNLITGGVFILLDCKACRNGGSQDTLEVEEIIAVMQIVSISENRESLCIILYLMQIVSIYVYMRSVLCSKGKLNESLYLRE
jgi:hypothetical protein